MIETRGVDALRVSQGTVVNGLAGLVDENRGAEGDDCDVGGLASTNVGHGENSSKGGS